MEQYILFSVNTPGFEVLLRVIHSFEIAVFNTQKFLLEIGAIDVRTVNKVGNTYFMVQNKFVFEAPPYDKDFWMRNQHNTWTLVQRPGKKKNVFLQKFIDLNLFVSSTPVKDICGYTPALWPGGGLLCAAPSLEIIKNVGIVAIAPPGSMSSQYGYEISKQEYVYLQEKKADDQDDFGAEAC